MLIDKFLPTYNLTAKQYSIEINAPIEDVYPVVRKLDLSEAYLTRLLLFVRSIPALLQGRPAIGHTLDALEAVSESPTRARCEASARGRGANAQAYLVDTASVRNEEIGPKTRARRRERGFETASRQDGVLPTW